MLQISWKLVGIKGLHGEICRRIKIRGRLSSSHAHRCTGEWNPCAQNSSTSLTLCFITTPKVTFVICPKGEAMCLDWFLGLESCSHLLSMGAAPFPEPRAVALSRGTLTLQSTEAKPCRGSPTARGRNLCSSWELCSATSHGDTSLPSWGHHLDPAGPSLPPRAPPAEPHLRLSAQNSGTLNSRTNMIQYLFCH